MNSRCRLSNQTILEASHGNSDAMEKVLAFYMGYINTIATEWSIGADGQIRHWLNEDRRSFICMGLIESILKWRRPQ